MRLEHFEKLDEEMKATLQELNVRGDDVQEVHAEFDKLYRSFLNVHNSELRYERRTRELRGEIIPSVPRPITSSRRMPASWREACN